MACMTEISRAIQAAIEKDPCNYGAYEDLLSLAKQAKQAGKKKVCYKTTGSLRKLIGHCLANGGDLDRLYPVYRETLKVEAPDILDSYLLFLEIDREPSTRFYQPRRKVLYPIVEGLQALVDNKLDELFISQPPRTGKTTLVQMFMTWIIGRTSNKSNLYSAYSSIITGAFYNGLLEIIQDPDTYNWNQVFPKSKIVSTNGAETTLDIDRRKKYHSFTARSLYGTLNGACDCDGFLISDDLIGGIEEALNPERLNSAWTKVDNNLLTRAKEGAKRIWIGTRWSQVDPIGKRLEMLEGDLRFRRIRYKIIDLPAMDENDESNFQYDFGVGFSTEYYRQRRASFERNNDLASWDAGYMQKPIEREGTLFFPSDFRYYNGVLPETPPDNVFMAIDPAFGGGDFVAAPICYRYGEDVYVVDVIYNNANKKITIPLIIKAIKRWDVQSVQIEANKSTLGYKEELERQLKSDGIRINLTYKPAPTNDGKVERVYNRAPDMRDFMIFLEPSKRERYYEQFMQNVFSFKTLVRKQHDDAPDSLAQAIDMMRAPSRKLQIFSRTF